jgi:hypothetical protein
MKLYKEITVVFLLDFMILKFKKQVLTIKIYPMNALQSYENILLKLLKSINLSRRRIAFAFRYFFKIYLN